MKTDRRLTRAAVSFALAVSLAPTVAPRADTRVVNYSAAAAQDSLSAMQRGYRTGYSDGYQSGFGDSATRAARDYRGKADYQSAERAYSAAYGPLEDYQDGYRQGFEAGYTAGFDRRPFDSTVPADLARRGDDQVASAPASTNTSTNSNAPVLRPIRRDDDDATTASSSSSGSGRVRDDNYGGQPSSSASRGGGAVPAGTTLRVELSNRLSTDVSFRGDPFEARVVEPRAYEGAVVSGRVSSVRRAGKARGSAELQLSFYQIRLPDGRYEDFSAQVVEVVTPGDEAGVGDVDPEGGVRGRSTTKDDAAKVGAGAGIGAIIGAIAGGGKGAAIGAILGGGAATGGVLTQRGKDIRLERGQELLIRSSR